MVAQRGAGFFNAVRIDKGLIMFFQPPEKLDVEEADNVGADAIHERSAGVGGLPEVIVFVATGPPDDAGAGGEEAGDDAAFAFEEIEPVGIARDELTRHGEFLHDHASVLPG